MRLFRRSSKADSEPTYIYLLLEPRPWHPLYGRVRYVGLTNDLAQRHSQHSAPPWSKSNAVVEWARELKEAEVGMVMVQYPTAKALSRKEAMRLEHALIGLLRRRGIDLLNERD